MEKLKYYIGKFYEIITSKCKIEFSYILYYPMIKLRLNKYEPKAFIFAEVYLSVHRDEYFGVPRHRVKPYLPSASFLEDLDDGALDTNEYNIKLYPFDWENYFIIDRYYNIHYDRHVNYDKYANTERLYNELGSNGSIFKNRRSKNIKRGGRGARRTSCRRRWT